MAGEAPKYQQVADDLRERIGSGEFPVGSALPSKPRLMKHYGVAQHTLDHAIEILREAGFADPQRGRGVFVLKPPEPGPSEYEILMGRLDEVSSEVKRLKARVSAAEEAFGLAQAGNPQPERPSADQASRLPQAEHTDEQAELIRSLQEDVERLQAQVMAIYAREGMTYNQEKVPKNRRAAG